MKLSVIALKIRAANTSFGDMVAGAAELALAQQETLREESAFVVPLSDTPSPNEQDSGYYQPLSETFSVVVALKNDDARFDQLGTTAIDRVDTIRAELFKAILNWVMPNTEGPIIYRAGRLLDLNPAWLWYTFEFALTTDLDEDDCIDPEDTDEFLEIYAQYITDPSLRPLDGVELPTSIAPPGLDQFITADHACSDGFSSGFDTLVALKNK